MCIQKTTLKSVEKKAKVLSSYEASKVIGGLYECFCCGAPYWAGSEHTCEPKK